MLKMFANLLSEIKQNPIEVLVYVLIISLLLWLFKEYRKIIEDEIIERKQMKNKEIEIYSHLESYLTLYQSIPNSDNLEKLTEQIGKSSPFLDYEYRRKLLSIISDPTEESVQKVLQWINNTNKELIKSSLKYRDIKISDRIEAFGIKVFIPLLYAFFTGWFFIFTTIIVAEGKSNFELLVDGFSAIILFFTLPLSLEKLLTENFKVKWRGMIAVILFSTGLYLMIIQNGWIWAILSILYIIILIFTFIKLSR